MMAKDYPANVRTLLIVLSCLDVDYNFAVPSADLNINAAKRKLFSTPSTSTATRTFDPAIPSTSKATSSYQIVDQIQESFSNPIGYYADAAQHLGKFLGKLSELHHGVSGEVYAVDARTLHIKDFTYDGQGPAAYFFATAGRRPDSSGFRIRDENGNPEVLRRYRKEGVTITLPDGKTLNSIKFFYIWCEEFEVNFGDIKIPRNFDYPRPQKIDGLRGVHGVASDNIVIVDAQTLLVPNLSYDGEAPDAKFWVGRGTKPSPQGVRVPDENGKEVPLRKYDRKTVVLTLPGDLTVFDIGHFGIWCEAFTVDFGHVQIPQQQLNVPPSLKMLGVSPQSKLNCEVLHDDLAYEVRWAVAGDSIVLQLVAKLANREYMSFGISGEEHRSAMVGGDVVVTWVDKETLKGYADDYYLDAKSQCSGPTGSCPDAKLTENSNNIRLLNAAMVNGYSIVTYQRPLRPSDQFDRQIFTNQSQPIIWAIGPLNQRDEVSFHSDYNKKDRFIDFGRQAKWNCPMPEGDQPSMKVTSNSPQLQEREEVIEQEEEEEVHTTTTIRSRNPDHRRRGGSNRTKEQESASTSSQQSSIRSNQRRRIATTTTSTTTTTTARPTPAPIALRNRAVPWDIPPIQCYEPDDGVFYAQMGPTGGKRGYPAITGHVGWGISWYINGLLIPVVNVVRGKTYTFVVEGGFDPDIPAKYHPFYITDDDVGGYGYKNAEERAKVKIFAGARLDKSENVVPTGVGRLCHWTHQGESDADDFESFGAYQRTLELRCDVGEPGVIQWTPDKDTPDTVYYQCFTHRYLGWKINVLDACDQTGAASEQHQEIVLPNLSDMDLEESPSIRVETKLKPNDLDIEILKDMNSKKRNDEFDNTDQLLDTDLSLINSANIPPTKEVVFYQELPNVDTKLPFDQKLFDGPSNFTLYPYPSNGKFPPKPYLISSGKPLYRRPPPPHQMMHLPPPPHYMKPHHMRPAMHHRMPPFLLKKPYFRPNVVKGPFNVRPVGVPQFPMMKYDKPIMIPNRPIILKPQFFKQNQDNISKPSVDQTIIKNVEISPEQRSTMQTPIAQPKSQDVPQDPYVNMLLAVNTGFKPDTVVMENGFRPIINKEIESRMANLDEEEENQRFVADLEFESEIGRLDDKDKKRETVDQDDTKKATVYFEPMFIPSPTIDVDKDRGEAKEPKDEKEDLKDDEITAANERVESYYLPPDNNKSKPVERAMQRSNIDIPPGTVITYDGKKVSGASLTIRMPEQRSLIFDPKHSNSKAAEFIRARPQFVLYQGELPPLDAQFVNAPQIQGRGYLNRELDTPVLPSASGSTKLLPVRNKDKSQLKKSDRKRRFAEPRKSHEAPKSSLLQ